MKKKQTKINRNANRLSFTIETNEMIVNQQKNKKRNGKIAPAYILALIWLGLYLISVNVPIHYFFLGTGRSGLNRASYHFRFIRDTLEYSYNLFFHAGPTGNIEMEYWRFLAIALAGASLAACGTIFQGTFRNVLAGPSTMGVMSGGSLGCMVYLVVFSSLPISEAASGARGTGSFLQMFGEQICVLAGCFGGVVIILLVTMIAGKGRVSSTTMVIAGTVFSGAISNILLIYQYFIIAQNPSDGRIEALRLMMMGHFDDTTSMASVFMMGIPIVICLALLMLNAGKLNVLSFGMEEAAAMGIDVNKYRSLMILTGTILTAMVVAFCGRIGFIGFMVPLVVRRVAGPDLKKLLPISIFAGAIFLTVIYNVAVLLGLQTYLSVITGPIGCIVMIFTLFRKGDKHAVDKSVCTQNMEIG